MNINSVSISGNVHRRVLSHVKRYFVRVRNTMTRHNERPCRRRKASSLNRNTFTVSSYSAEVQINSMYVIYSSRGSGCFRNHLLHTTYYILYVLLTEDQRNDQYAFHSHCRTQAGYPECVSHMRFMTAKSL